MGDQKQFDEDIGGHMRLPPMLNHLNFSTARHKELSEMANFLENCSSTKMIFQKLPIHMRRRTMSHNSMRLPRRLREAHIKQMSKSGLPTKSLKRPSRKFRRRPKNLLKEYIRRQRKFVWLETHIWHAKRFHMTERWGYKLPETSCNRAFRSCYRATSKHCLLQDISYYGCIELTGKYDILIDGFKHSTSPQCGLTFAAKAFLNGHREGRVIVFKKDSFPHYAIGEVSFIWRPVENTGSDTRTIWIFVHAAFYNDILENFLDCFKLKLKDQTESVSNECIIVECEAAEFEIENMETATTSEMFTDKSNTVELSTKDKKYQTKHNKKPNKLNNDIKQLETRNIPFTRTKKYVNKNGIQLVELKDTINRFRLTGPLSQAILHKALEPLSTNAPKTWFKTHLQNPNFKTAHKSQVEFWRSITSIQSPAELPPHLILGLNVVDPRVNRPEKRTKAIPELSEELDCTFAYNNENISETLSHSVIWDSSMRDNIIQKKLSTFGLNKLRNKYSMIPGEPCEFEKNVQGIPVLLIQRPGSQVSEEKRVGYGSGWDIIVPAGYGMAVWLSLILYGAKSGGVRESRNIAFESLKNYLAPDTTAGQLEEQLVYKKKRTAYFRLAPNRRINYIKYGINSPFICKWSLLLNDWSNKDSKDFYVLRDFKLLAELQIYIQNNKAPKEIDFMSRCLVPVILTLVHKGAPKDFAIICLPKQKKVCKNKKIKLHDTDEPEEPLHDDPQKSERNHSREEHFKLLKRLRQRRIRMKRLLQETSNKPVSIQKPNNEKIIASQLKKIQQLWLPEDITTVRHQCNYEVMGYVTKGDFSFTEATSVAVGYVTLSSIQTLMTKFNKNLVLVRDTSSRQYRYAHLKIMK